MSVIYTDNRNFGENMRNFLVLTCLFTLGMPVSADIINPNLTPEQMQKVREQRQKMYVERQRFSTINRVCGHLNSSEETADCKKKLYDDYLETVNFLEDKYIDVQARKAK